MKRRSFFGVAAGAVVAGPTMAKQALAQGIESLSVPSQLGYVGGLGGIGSAVPQAANSYGVIDSVLNAKKKLDLINSLSDPTKRAKYRRQMGGPSMLDPDIASYRSISLSAKIEWQIERNLEKFLSERRSWWERIADGTYDPYSAASSYDDNESLY